MRSTVCVVLLYYDLKLEIEGWDKEMKANRVMKLKMRCKVTKLIRIIKGTWEGARRGCLCLTLSEKQEGPIFEMLASWILNRDSYLL